MKKYKLIKKYPTCWWNIGDIIHYNEGYYTGNNRNFYESPSEFPEFWEEVVEKEYEILSFYAKNIAGKGANYVDPQYIWYKTSNNSNKWSRLGHITQPYTTEEIQNHVGYAIHSVKRLSDGEIFSIGDQVTHLSYSWNIKEFSLKDYRCFAEGVGSSYIEKDKLPLLTTEDGIKIFDEKQLLWDTLDYTMNNRGCDLNFLGQTPVSSAININRKFWYSKEKAEEYILMNKPVLSLKDVFSIYPQYKKNSPLELTKHAEELIKLAKSKI